MKLLKSIISVTVFVSMVIALMIPVSYILRPVDTERERIMGFYAEEEDSLDAVVVGSSAMYRYINNPYMWKNYGITSYNYATPGLSLFLVEDLISEIERTQSPEVYIIDARKYALCKTAELDEIRFQQVATNMRYSFGRIKMIDKFIDDPISKLEYTADILLYHGNWDQVSKEDLKYWDNAHPNEMKGWSTMKKVRTIPYTDVTDLEEEEPIHEAAEEALYSLMNKCKKENIKLLFVATPWGISEEQQKKSNYTKRIVEENGFDYIDMNRLWNEVGMDHEKHFYNKNHVNTPGSEKVTAYLAEYLQKNYDMDREHSKSVVESWDKAVETCDKEWAAKMKKSKK